MELERSSANAVALKAGKMTRTDEVHEEEERVEEIPSDLGGGELRLRLVRDHHDQRDAENGEAGELAQEEPVLPEVGAKLTEKDRPAQVPQPLRERGEVPGQESARGGRGLPTGHRPS